MRTFLNFDWPRAVQLLVNIVQITKQSANFPQNEALLLTFRNKKYHSLQNKCTQTKWLPSRFLAGNGLFFICAMLPTYLCGSNAKTSTIIHTSVSKHIYLHVGE